MIILCVLLCVAAFSIIMCVAYKEGFSEPLQCLLRTSLKVGELSSHYEKIFKKIKKSIYNSQISLNIFPIPLL